MWRGFLLLIAAAGALAETVPHGTLSLISESSALKSGGESLLGLEFKLDPGWHIYWKNPGDSGVQPQVRWTVPAGVHIAPLLWPAPQRIKDHGLVDYGYQGSVVLLAPLNVVSGRKGDVQVTANVHWAVCSSTCVMVIAKLSKSIPISTAAARGLESPEIAKAQSQLPKPLPAACAPLVIDGKDFFTLHLSCANMPSQLTFFPLETSEIDNAAPQPVTRDARIISIKLMKSDQFLYSPTKLEGVLETGNGGPAYTVAAQVKLRN